MWYEKAAEQGDVYAQHIVAKMYEEGKGVPQDYSKALEWFGKVCDSGRQEGCDDYRILNQK